MILAQADLTAVPSDHLKWTLVILLALAMVATAIIVVVQGFKRTSMEIDGQPISVTKAPKGFNFELCQERHTSIDHRLCALENWRTTLMEKLESDKAEIITSGDERAANIYKHVDAVRKELTEKLDNVPDRVIATLRNTGAI